VEILFKSCGKEEKKNKLKNWQNFPTIIISFSKVISLN
jgi:hypothetical protein